MIKIDANRVSEYLSRNQVDEPVLSKRLDEPLAVMISYETYKVMHRENRTALRADELSDDDIKAIRSSRP